MYPGEKVYIAAGHPNRPGSKLTALKAVIIHYTGNEAPTADAHMNADYFGRKYRAVDGAGGSVLCEADAKTPFSYGSAQVIADMNTVVETMPLDEVAWGCGDRRLPYDDLNKGQQPAARLIFENKQNFQTLSVEICDNDAIKNSDADWLAAVKNANDWVVAFLKDKKLKVDLAQSLDPNNFKSLAAGSVLVMRHYDVTGKICPKPFVDDATAWKAFLQDIATKVNA